MRLAVALAIKYSPDEMRGPVDGSLQAPQHARAVDSSSPGPSRGRPLWISQKIFDLSADDIAPVYHLSLIHI